MIKEKGKKGPDLFWVKQTVAESGPVFPTTSDLLERLFKNKPGIFFRATL
jgi:hypothetical protein